MENEWAQALGASSIAFALAFYFTSTAWFAHRERMKMIEKGLDPDPARRERMAMIEKGLDPDSGEPRQQVQK